MSLDAFLMVIAVETATVLDPLAGVKSWVEIIGNVVTPLAVIVGAIWAYFRFYKERTYRPHIEVAVADEWIPQAGVSIAVTLQNIGKARFDLVSEGTALQISLPAQGQPGPVREFVWTPAAAFSIFEKHAWIEPGESVKDQLLVRLDDADYLIEATVRLVFRTHRAPIFKSRPANIEVQARRVLTRHNPTVREQPAKERSHGRNTDARGQGRNSRLGKTQEQDEEFTAGPAGRGSRGDQASRISEEEDEATRLP